MALETWAQIGNGDPSIYGRQREDGSRFFEWRGPTWKPVGLSYNPFVNRAIPPPLLAYVWPQAMRRWKAEEVVRCLERASGTSVLPASWLLRETKRRLTYARTEFARSDGWHFFTWLWWRSQGEFYLANRRCWRAFFRGLYRLGWLDLEKQEANFSYESLFGPLALIRDCARIKKPVWLPRPEHWS